MNFTENYTKFRQYTYKWRAKYFLPFLKLLAALKITPNQITIFRFFFIIPIGYFVYLENLSGVLVFYVLFWVLDLFDGSLARYLNATHDRGGFLDSVVDHFVYSLVVMAFIYLGAGQSLILIYNIIIQLFVSLLANVAVWKKEESNWLIKVKPNVPYFKTLAHLILFIYYLGYNFVDAGFIILNIWMTITAIYYFIKIKNKAV